MPGRLPFDPPPSRAYGSFPLAERVIGLFLRNEEYTTCLCEWCHILHRAWSGKRPNGSKLVLARPHSSTSYDWTLLSQFWLTKEAKFHSSVQLLFSDRTLTTVSSSYIEVPVAYMNEKIVLVKILFIFNSVDFDIIWTCMEFVFVI